MRTRVVGLVVSLAAVTVADLPAGYAQAAAELQLAIEAGDVEASGQCGP